MILITTAGKVRSAAARLLAQREEPVRVLARDPADQEYITDQERSLMASIADTSRTAHLLALMKRGGDAFNSHDVAAMDALCHPDMIAHVTGNAGPLYGRAAHAAAIEQMFRMFPDVHVSNDPYPVASGSGNWTTVITHLTGTFTGEMVLPDGTVIPPTGKAFDVEFRETVMWDGDRILEIAAFWDAALQARQIGLAEPGV